MTLLYIEPFGGMAGDMFLAAMLDLGDPRLTLEDLRGLAQELVPGAARLSTERVRRGGLAGTLLRVETPESGAAPHRHYADLARRIEASPLGERARERACATLRAIAEAEARVHATTVEKVHFHEVGAIDTLIDVGGAALAIERLGIERVFASPPLLGEGTVHCEHGELPVPPPAVAEILRSLPARLGGGPGERLTPTGAAVLANCVDAFEAPGPFTARAIGYGAGVREPEAGPANLVRVQLGEAEGGALRARAWLLEVNLDDMTGEEIGHAVAALRAAGALEVWTASVQMKKDRPGVVLSALARGEQRPALERVLFELTTTLGVRWREVERTECGRRTLTVQLAGVAVRVKVRERPAYQERSPFGERDLAPEHDDLEAVVRAGGLTLREARRRAIESALAQLGA